MPRSESVTQLARRLMATTRDDASLVTRPPRDSTHVATSLSGLAAARNASRRISILAPAARRQTRVAIPDNMAARQRFFELLVTRLGDQGVVEIQQFQMPERRQSVDSRIGDAGAVKAQLLEIFQRLEFRQSGVGDRRVVQIQL